MYKIALYDFFFFLKYQKQDIHLKLVIFRIFNGLLLTKSVKKYIQPE